MIFPRCPRPLQAFFGPLRRHLQPASGFRHFWCLLLAWVGHPAAQTLRHLAAAARHRHRTSCAVFLDVTVHGPGVTSVWAWIRTRGGGSGATPTAAGKSVRGRLRRGRGPPFQGGARFEEGRVSALISAPVRANISAKRTGHFSPPDRPRFLRKLSLNSAAYFVWELKYCRSKSFNGLFHFPDAKRFCNASWMVLSVTLSNRVLDHSQFSRQYLR